MARFLHGELLEPARGFLSALVFCLWLEHDRRQDLAIRSCVSALVFYSGDLYMLVLFLWDVDYMDLLDTLK